jgi:hypothetical protein
MIWRQNQDIAGGQGPHGRYVYTETVAAFSALMSLIWLIPFTGSMMHYPLDLFISIAWFAAFATLMQWIGTNGITCSGVFGLWSWDGSTHNYYCTEYQTLEGFTLISAVTWLFSAFLVSFRFAYRIISEDSNHRKEYSRISSCPGPHFKR